MPARRALRLEDLVEALLRARLAGLDTVWALGFADVRRAARLICPPSAQPPSPHELAALMQAYPDNTQDEEKHDGR